MSGPADFEGIERLGGAYQQGSPRRHRWVSMTPVSRLRRGVAEEQGASNLANIGDNMHLDLSIPDRSLPGVIFAMPDRFSSAPRTPIVEFYQRRVLPKLFGRLDEIFPEFGWVRVTPDRWRASNDVFTQESFAAPAARVEVHRKAPFGFSIAGNQGFIPWTSYMIAGRASTVWDVVESIRTVAGKLGVHGRLAQHISAEDQLLRRRRELLESCMARCCHCLREDEDLRRRVGVRWSLSAEALAQGVAIGYFERDGLAEWLRGLGFTPDELDASGLFTDASWDKRFIAPWRNRWGVISALVAEGREGLELLTHPDAPPPPVFVGHDVALRLGDDVIVVQGFFEVLTLHSLGWTQVIGLPDRRLDARRWATLRRWGVKRVRLLFDSTSEGQQSLFAALQARAEVYDAPEAEQIKLDVIGGTIEELLRSSDARGRLAALFDESSPEEEPEEEEPEAEALDPEATRQRRRAFSYEIARDAAMHGLDYEDVLAMTEEEDAAEEDAAEEDAVEEDAVEEDAVEEDAAEEDAVEEDAVEEDAVEDDAVEEDAVEDDAAEEDVAEEDTQRS